MIRWKTSYLKEWRRLKRSGLGREADVRAMLKNAGQRRIRKH